MEKYTLLANIKNMYCDTFRYAVQEGVLFKSCNVAFRGTFQIWKIEVTHFMKQYDGCEQTAELNCCHKLQYKKTIFIVRPYTNQKRCGTFMSEARNLQIKT